MRRRGFFRKCSALYKCHIKVSTPFIISFQRAVSAIDAILAVAFQTALANFFNTANRAVQGLTGIANGAENLVVGFVRLVEPHADFAAFLIERSGRLTAANREAGFLQIEK